MTWIERLPLVVAAGVVGAIVGSFIATLCLRWPNGETASTGRSRCDHCGIQLEARDLVPLLSAWLAKGSCRRCGARIDPFHRRVELAAAAIGTVSAFAGDIAQAASLAIFGWLLLPLLLLDWRHLWLPNKLIVLLAFAGLLLGGFLSTVALGTRLIGGMVGFGSLFLLAAMYQRARGREGLGAGDPKLFGAIGLWLGWTALPLVLLLAGMMGLLLVLVKRSTMTSESQLPLGSMLAASAWILGAAMIGSW